MWWNIFCFSIVVWTKQAGQQLMINFITDWSIYYVLNHLISWLVYKTHAQDDVVKCLALSSTQDIQFMSQRSKSKILSVKLQRENCVKFVL